MTGRPWPKSTWPRAYDLVWTRFPHSETPHKPAIKPRPSLVLGVFELPDGSALLEVAPGSTNLKVDRRPLDFRVTNYAEMQAAGLIKATRFDLGKAMDLPYTHTWFVPLTAANKTTPVLGSMSPSMVTAFQTHLAWLDHLASEADDDEPE